MNGENWPIVRTVEEKDPELSFSRKDLTPRQWLSITFLEAPTELVEFLFSVVLIGWGLWVMMPWWSVFSLAPTVYRGMLAVIPDEFAWGMISAVLGSVMMRALYDDARLTRFVCAVALTSYWGCYAVAFWFSDWRSPAGLWFTIFTVFSAWLLRRNKARYLAEQIRLRRQRQQ